MPVVTRSVLRSAGAAAALIFTAWACLGTPAAQDADPRGPTAAAPTATAAGLLPEPTQQPQPTAGSCEPPAEKIDLGGTVSGEITGADQPPGERRYFCVDIPQEVAEFTITLTGATADLNLYVGHPDLESVQDGGLWFWSSVVGGAGDESVRVTPGIGDYVRPGPYYIEVSAGDFEDSSPFILSVQLP